MPDKEVAGHEGFQKLWVLAIGHCNLTGQIPFWLTRLKKLEALDISLNHLTGSIPGWLGSLLSLYYLDLSGNRFSGEIPVELTSSPVSVLVNATAQLDKSYLEFPIYLANRLYYSQISNLLPAIYLSNNNLSGKIPPEIGRLQFLHALDLSHNHLSGNIPDQLCNLTKLEKLDLSGNQLSGEIPPSLRHLYFLSSFSVAYNNLTGQIPSGNQFDIFQSSSFDGNPWLCGGAYDKEHPCDNQNIELSTIKPNDGFDKEIILRFTIGGFVFGFFIAIKASWMFLSRKSQIRRTHGGMILHINMDMIPLELLLETVYIVTGGSSVCLL